ncbi:MAG: hypothetical protein MK102_01015 [Fuerstiella sp.]|nr:hypothetical protein [Fuerstiella sp.]
MAVFDLESLSSDHRGAAVKKIVEQIRILCLVLLFALSTSNTAIPDQTSTASGTNEWLLYSAKGVRAPDGSGSAPVVGIIRADGNAEQYPDFGVPGQKGWQLGPQFSDGKFVARSFQDITTAAAVSGRRNGSIWLFDFKSGRIERELLTDFVGGNSDISVDLVLPGGRLLVGVIDKNGQRQLYDTNLSGGDARAITSAGEGFHYGTHLSPDRSRLSCHLTGGIRQRKSGLIESPFRVGYYAINVMGLSGRPRTLVHGEKGHLFFDPRWSPDGRSLIYLDCLPQTDPGHTRADLVLATVDNTAPGGWLTRRLTTDQRQWFGTAYGPADARGGGSNTSSWSPDGRFITWTRLTPGAHMDCYFDPTRPSHEENVFAPERAKGGTQICLLAPETGEVVELTEAVEHRWDFRPRWSKSGHLIAFVRCMVGSHAELWVMQADGSDQRRLTAGPAHAPRGCDHPRWISWPGSVVEDR